MTNDDESGRSFWVASDLVAGAGQSDGPRHARKSSSKYAVYIGRVGALAVSLGVGLAVVNGPDVAVAFAGTDSDSGAGSSAGASSGGDGSSGSGDTGSGDAGAATGSSVGGGAAGADGKASEGADTGTGAGTDSDAGAGAGADVDTDADAGAGDGGATTDTAAGTGGTDSEDADSGGADSGDTDVVSGNDGSTEQPPASDDKGAAGAADGQAAPAAQGQQAAGGAGQPAPVSGGPAGGPEASGETAAPEAVDNAAKPDVSDAEQVSPAGDVSAADHAVVAQGVSLRAASAEVSTAEDSATPQPTVIAVAAAVLDTIFFPYTTPTIPTGSWLDILIATVWRDISHTWFNKTPVATYTSRQVLLTTEFTMDVVDPNGDPLSFAIVQPEHGLVTWVPFTNKFLYTPDLFYTGDPVTETFKIIFSDSAQNDKPGDWLHDLTHGLARSWGLAQPDDLTLTIPILVKPVYAAPLVTTVGAPSFTLQGNPVKLLSAASIVDADSDEMSGAVVKLTTLSQDGDVLGYTAPQDSPVTGVWDAATKTLTLSGTATKAQYEEALKAVTFSATQGALLVRGVEIWVTDTSNTTSLTPGVALVNVFNPLAPAVGVAGAPAFTLQGDPVTVLSSVTITDGDSTELSGATMKLTTLAQDGDELIYTQPSNNPITGSWDAATKTLTLSGTATIDQYEQALKAVTFTATQGALLVRGVEVWVTDSTHMESLLPGVALVNVFNPLAPAIGTIGASSYTLQGDPVTVLSSVTITDGDSTELSGATVKLTTLSQSGDVLSYTAPQDNPITATWDAATKTLTLSGTATIDQYEQALKAVTFTATQGALLVRGVEVWVTDTTGMESIAPGVALINVFSPLAPAIGTVGAPTFTLEGSPVTVLSSVTITDGDSTTLSGAAVKLTTLSQSGDVLGYTAPQDNPITGVWDAATKTLTLSGTATIDQYEQALKAVTFSATQGALLVRGVEVWVTDSTNVESIAPGVALINVAAPIRLAPAIATVGTPTFTLEGSPVTVLSSVTITDGDSTTLSGAAVKLTTLSQSGDVLSYTAPQDNPITGVWDAATKTLTLSGTGTIAEYAAALKAVTFSATQGALLVRGVEVWVTDSTNVQSIAPGVALINVAAPIRLAPAIATAGTPTFTLEGSPVTVLSSVTITDGDSTTLSGAAVKLTTLSQSGDVLDYTAPQDNPITGVWDAATKTLTLSGTGTIAEYAAALKAVTFSATQGAALVRGVEVWVTDSTNVESIAPGVALINVAAPIRLAPAIGTAGTPTFTLEGSPVTVLSSVTITDGDSTTLSGAAVKLTTLAQPGDVLGYTAPQDNPITATWDAATKTLTLSGTGTLDQYEQALKAVTFSATQGAALVRGVEVWVTDSTNVESIAPGVALINVAAPIRLAPAIATAGTPTFTLEGSPVTVLSSVTITDGDSTTLSGAAVKLTTLSQSGDVLSYTAPQDNPITGVWDAATKTLTLSGTGTIAEYAAALKAVTFSATQGAALVRGVEVWVTDSTNVESIAPGVALINVAAPIRLAPAIGTFGASTFTLDGSPVTVLSSVTITDADSTTLSGAAVKLTTLSQSGDVLSYTAPQNNPITATWDAATKTLTLSGTGTLDQYEQALKAVTFTATQGALLVRGVEVWVTDSTNVESIGPGIATINVNPAPLIPLVSTLGAPNYIIGKSPVQLLSSVTITDGDSANMSGATVKINTLGQTGDVLGYTAPQDNPITGVWDAATKTLTLSGTATKAQYEEALKAVTFSATQGAALVRGFLISVTDSTGLSSGWSGAATATVASPAAPAIGTLGAPTFTLEGDPVTVLTSVTITDVDSDSLSGATVKINTLGQTGDVLGYTAPQNNPITATYDAATKTLTLTGTGTLDQYEQALKAVTFTATQGAGLVRGLLINVTDDTNVQSIAAGVATINVNAAPLIPLVSTLGAPNYIIGKPAVQLLSSVTVTDGDSANMSGATVKINTLGQTGDVLSYTAPQNNPITGVWDAATKTLTLSGTATKAQYEEALKAVKFSATQGAALVRGFLISVTDSTGLSSGWSGAATATVANPAAPAIATLGASTFTLEGSAVTVLSSVTITDVDSDSLSGATVKINTLGQSGDVLGYTAPQNNPITATWDASSKTLSLSGTGTIDQYVAALKAVTFTATQGAGLVRGLLINVTDDTNVQSIAAGVATINVNAAPLIPLVSTLGAPNYVIGKPAVQLLSSVTVTDGDSANMSGALVKINTLGQTGDVLSYTAPSNNPVTATWDAASKTLTLSGTATKAQYEEALKAVKFSATQGAALVRGFLISVIDSTGLSSGWSGAATATVANPVGPTLAVAGVSTYVIGKTGTTIMPSLTLSDSDSTVLTGAKVTIATLAQSGDVLSYAGIGGNPITATWDSGSKTLTLSGTATLDQYKAALQAITFTATGNAGLVRGVSVYVTDDTALNSATGFVTVNVNNPVASAIAVLTGPTGNNNGTTKTRLFSSATITDADSTVLTGATVYISVSAYSNDKIYFDGIAGIPVTGSYNSGTKTLTLTGTATLAQYEQVIEAVTWTSTQGWGIIRSFQVRVIDDSGLISPYSFVSIAPY